jgi:hypothetical protein
MPLVLADLDPSIDCWISQAEFFTRSRKLVHFKQTGLCWADLDTYKVPELADKSPEALHEVLLRTCEAMELPAPSIVVFSGRGLQAKWLLEAPLPRQALPRWNLVQRELCRRLVSVGGDPKSCDGSRVLRLVNTVNTKSGEMVRVIDASLKRYRFDKLADSLLPLTRAELQALREARKAAEAGGMQLELFSSGLVTPAPIRPRGHLVVADSSKANLKTFLPSQLAWDRLGDLDKLAALRRYAHGAPDGHRDSFVFLGAAFLAWAVPQVPKFTGEVRALADKYAPHWSSERVRQCVSGVSDRMARFRAGERVQYDNKDFDPRYRFGNAKLLDWLEITPAEERELTTIISQSESRRRDAARHKEAHREAGGVSREVYVSNHEQKRATARLMRAQGKSWSEVAQELGYKNAETARVACRSSETKP